MNEMWEGALFPSGHSSVSECGGCFCSHPAAVWALCIHDLNKEGIWDRWMDRTRCKWSGEGPNNQTIAVTRTMGWQLAGRSTRQLTPNALEDDGGRVSWDQSGCVATTQQFLCLHWRLNFNKGDERRCAELILSSLDTQTIALDVPTQEQVVNKRWIIQNSVVLAWKQSCRRPPKVTNGRNKHAIVLLGPPRNWRMRRLSARDIALRAERGAASRAISIAAAAVRHYRLRLRHRHLNHRHLQNGVWNRRPK